MIRTSGTDRDAAPGRPRRGAGSAFRPGAEALEARQLMAVAPAAPDPSLAGPAIRSIRVPEAGTYATGEALRFRVQFDHPVRVAGAPTLPVEIGAEVVPARLVAGARRGFSRSLVFEATVSPHDFDRDGIALGTVGVQDGRPVRRLAGASGIVDRAGRSASPVLPDGADARRVLVDASGPGVRGFGFVRLPATRVRAGRTITLAVTFDRAVTVNGRPAIPFRAGGRDAWLAYAGGSGTKTLRFTYRAKAALDPRTVGFRPDLGEAIYLPGSRASISDRRGNAADLVRDPSGEVLRAEGRRVVVLGAYYQFLRRVGADELNDVLNVQSRAFLASTDPPASFVVPTYVQARYDVDLYKVTYNSAIPERGDRPTTATGLVAIPVPNASDPAGPGPIARPVVSYQHGTVYGLHQVPSYSFTPDATGGADLDSYETRLAVAQFAGQGYALVAADYFGMGDSSWSDSYAVKGSEQQACLDLFRASASLLRREGVEPGPLLLSGWSQGGLVTMAFLQRLEQEGIPVAGASTASAPSDVLAATTTLLLNRRDASAETPDAAWINTIFIIAAFSYEQYHDSPGLAYDFFNPQYYEACRRVYARDYDHLGYDAAANALLVYPTAGDADPLPVPADLTRLIRPEVFDPNATGPGPRYYPFSPLAKLMDDAGAYRWAIRTPVQLNYGLNDEAFSTAVALIPYHYQQIINKANPIEALPVTGGNHRGTFLAAVDRQLAWFDALLGRGRPAS